MFALRCAIGELLHHRQALGHASLLAVFLRLDLLVERALHERGDAARALRPSARIAGLAGTEAGGPIASRLGLPSSLRESGRGRGESASQAIPPESAPDFAPRSSAFSSQVGARAPLPTGGRFASGARGRIERLSGRMEARAFAGQRLPSPDGGVDRPTGRRVAGVATAEPMRPERPRFARACDRGNGFPPPLWGRARKGGLAMLFQTSASRAQIAKRRATPHPNPPPPLGVRKDARLSMGYGGGGAGGALVFGLAWLLPGARPASILRSISLTSKPVASMVKSRSRLLCSSRSRPSRPSSQEASSLSRLSAIMKARRSASFRWPSVIAGASFSPSRLAASSRPCPASTTPFSSTRIGTLKPNAKMLSAMRATCRTECFRAFLLSGFKASTGSQRTAIGAAARAIARAPSDAEGRASLRTRFRARPTRSAAPSADAAGSIWFVMRVGPLSLTGIPL